MATADPWESPWQRAKPVIVRAAVFCSLGAAGLIATLALLPAFAGLAIYAYVLALGTIAVFSAASLMARTIPASREWPPVWPWAVRVERPAEIERLETLAMLAAGSAADLHYRLRPLLRDIASQRLAVHRAIDMDRQPEQARLALGPATWELLRPDRPDPADRHARGFGLPWQRRIIDAVEAL
ncbi:MAG: hypothetical protein ACYDAG_02380 [Chloroflexota bacterium]